jgi:hypothetical protein
MLPLPWQVKEIFHPEVIPPVGSTARLLHRTPLPIFAIQALPLRVYPAEQLKVHVLGKMLYVRVLLGVRDEPFRVWIY